MTMLLVGRYASPYVRRVGVSLHLLGLPFERHVVSPLTDPAGVRRFNPMGRVPVLVLDSGERLIESAAILDHLQEQAPPAQRLIAARGPDRRRALQLSALMTHALEKAVYALYEDIKRPPEKRHEPWRAQLLQQVDAGLGLLEAEAGAPWLVGERVGLADVTVAVGWRFLCGLAATHDVAGRYPRLAAHGLRCEALPVFAACTPERA
jgi:glutathione S-transferase